MITVSLLKWFRYGLFAFGTIAAAWAAVFTSQNTCSHEGLRVKFVLMSIPALLVNTRTMCLCSYARKQLQQGRCGRTKIYNMVNSGVRGVKQERRPTSGPRFRQHSTLCYARAAEGGAEEERRRDEGTGEGAKQVAWGAGGKAAGAWVIGG